MVQVRGREGLSVGSTEALLWGRRILEVGKEDSGSGEERCKAWQIWEDGAGAPDGRVRKKVVGGKAGRGEVKADIVDLLSLPSPGRGGSRLPGKVLGEASETSESTSCQLLWPHQP